MLLKRVSEEALSHSESAKAHDCLPPLTSRDLRSLLKISRALEVTLTLTFTYLTDGLLFPTLSLLSKLQSKQFIHLYLGLPRQNQRFSPFILNRFDYILSQKFEWSRLSVVRKVYAGQNTT